MYKFSIALFVPLLASAQMNITTSERVEALLSPDVLRGSLSFEEQGKNQNIIKEHLNTVVAEVKRFDPEAKMCHGGGYYLSPQYSYKNNVREFIGYGATLNFGCEFTNIDTYNELSAAIDKVMVSSVRMSQGSLDWGVSSAKDAQMQGKLRIELMRKAHDQAEIFSKETTMACRVSTVNFSGANHPVMPMMARSMMMTASASTESPIRSDETTALEASVEYICEK
jgi:uncharacterized protein YggE